MSKLGFIELEEQASSFVSATTILLLFVRTLCKGILLIVLIGVVEEAMSSRHCNFVTSVETSLAKLQADGWGEVAFSGVVEVGVGLILWILAG